MTDLQGMISFLEEYEGEPIRIMEVCGTHTAAISESGIPQIISPKIKLISGPGCPVCVTVASYIDRLVEIAMQDGKCVVTFGDMIRVCGGEKSLGEARADGADVRMVYSPFDTLELAKKEPQTEFVFAAVGFETTTPIYAMLLESIINSEIKNIKFLTALKTMPAVIDCVCAGGAPVDGFIAPGHVSVITGYEIFRPLAEKYNLPFAVSGFEAENLIESIYTIIKLKGTPSVKNLYTEAVTAGGNEIAHNAVNRYFKPCPAAWRGLGIIENSGMVLRDEYKKFDMGSELLVTDNAKRNGCRCKDVICGRISPTECGLFGKKCTPQTPSGACMVSTEGSCFNYFVNKRV